MDVLFINGSHITTSLHSSTPIPQSTMKEPHTYTPNAHTLSSALIPTARSFFPSWHSDHHPILQSLSDPPERPRSENGVVYIHPVERSKLSKPNH
ncbi:hypothetical protein BO78DRAFT_237445 [Aspergillus sclerotiicarbonarius CBS 121057]|uniref:Uncharacterized protein n=1 Tax=Aspergillus sclerotiicarbonarius (strain CBS 121057 / IBT 28362) TaxID=1448318 RepID=A0A319EJ37_ASPSB|nr:hypothetical protein BO78DRAFT_237445 [Aspergillus sclerotiicarbonarius CBS 121057]